MKILVVTNMLPTADRPVFGIFVKEQTDSFKDQFPDDILEVLAFNRGGSFRRYFLSIFELIAKILGFRPDVVHIHYGLTFLPVLFALPLCKVLGVKIITTFHGSDILGSSRITGTVSKIAVRFSDVVIGVSRQIENKLAQSHDNVAYIPCGVTAEFSRLSQTIKSNRSRKIIFPSTPARPEKNYPLFERLTKRLAQESSDLMFETVSLDGLTREQVATLFKTSACLLMTSKYEGSPQVIKEAMLCDLPIVSTAVGDVPNLLANLKDAVVSNDEDVLLAGIRRFVTAETLMDADYDDEVKRSVLNDVVCEKLVSIYRGLT